MADRNPQARVVMVAFLAMSSAVLALYLTDSRSESRKTSRGRYGSHPWEVSLHDRAPFQENISSCGRQKIAAVESDSDHSGDLQSRLDVELQPGMSEVDLRSQINATGEFVFYNCLRSKVTMYQVADNREFMVCAFFNRTRSDSTSTLWGLRRWELHPCAPSLFTPSDDVIISSGLFAPPEEIDRID